MYDVTIGQAVTREEIASAQELFREYESWLGLDLCFQGFEAELASLPGKYAAPEGRLLLARIGDGLAGCIAMRSLDNGTCEMKRLFVRNEFRGRQIGLKLVEQLLKEARLEGYTRMRLDTYPPKMGKAVSIYTSHGFVPIEPYYDNPHEAVLFLEIAL